MSTLTNNSDYNYHWIVADDDTNLYSICDSSTTVVDKYEQLPSFVGGLFIENGEIKLKKPDNSIVVLGKPSKILGNKIIELILDKIYDNK